MQSGADPLVRGRRPRRLALVFVELEVAGPGGPARTRGSNPLAVRRFSSHWMGCKPMRYTHVNAWNSGPLDRRLQQSRCCAAMSNKLLGVNAKRDHPAAKAASSFTRLNALPRSRSASIPQAGCPANAAASMSATAPAWPSRINLIGIWLPRSGWGLCSHVRTCSLDWRISDSSEIVCATGASGC